MPFAKAEIPPKCSIARLSSVMRGLSTNVDSLSTVVDCDFKHLLYSRPMNMGGRINQCLQELGWEQVDLLSKIPDLEPATLSALITRDSKKSTYAMKIAEALGVNARWLVDDEGERWISPSLRYDIKKTASIRAITDTKIRPFLTTESPNIAECRGNYTSIPIINYVQAGVWTETIESAQLGDDLQWTYTDYPAKKNLFALRVQGDSMEPEFPEGTLLIVDPGADWRSGCYVIAKNGDHEATFKQITRDGGVWYLKPVNPRYPVQQMPDTCEVIGVVVQAIRNVYNRRAEP
jgi:SOS-response transcriptional repressor LexA